MRRAKTAAMLVGLSLQLACREPAPAPIEPTVSAVLDTAPRSELSPEPDPAPVQLATRGIHDDDFARSVLYTWTRIEQLGPLRASERLLVADATSGGWSTPFVRALAQLPNDGSPAGAFAQHLREDPELRRHRYAWPNPFATTMGMGERRYGDVLIRIELDERAWIARFEPGAEPPFRVVDLEGTPVGLAQVVDEPTRVAAIFHVNGPPRTRIHFREYVVCNEAMIREWSIATEEIREVVADEVALLEGLRERSFAQLPRAAFAEAAHPDWLRANAAATPLSLWHATLAFDNPRYRPGGAELEAIVTTLAGLRDDGGPPLRVSPAHAQPSSGAP